MIKELTRQSNLYEFKYRGDFEALDAIAVLQTQLSFISILNEIKNQVAPHAKLSVKLQGLKKGSLEVHQLVELAIPAGLFVVSNYDTVKGIFQILGDLFALKSLLGGKKADVINYIDNSVHVTLNVNGNNNTVVASPEAWKLYQENPKINDGIIRTGKALDESTDVNEVEVKQLSTNDPIARIERPALTKIKEENAYSDTTFQYEIENNQIIGIKRANLLPEAGRVLKWDVLFRNQNISIKITDQDFIDQITKGLRFGNGDKLLVDIKKSMRLDKTYNMFVETGHYEAFKVYKLIPREEQSNIQFP